MFYVNEGDKNLKDYAMQIFGLLQNMVFFLTFLTFLKQNHRANCKSP